MARTKSAEVWALWRDRLRRYLSSDLTVAAFCDWEGVSQAAFYVWRNKLQADSGLPSRKGAICPVRPKSSVFPDLKLH
jgi:transposase-like protein